jgi:hypothetical protein
VNHFQPGQHVRLTLPELGGLAAQVVEVAPDYLVMALFLNGRDAPSAIEYADVALEYTAVRGLYRTRGTVRFDVGGVEILRFVPRGDPELISEEQEPIDARGAVLRELGDGSLGVHFDFILDQDRERLVRFLFERQRLMRQLERG